MPNEAVAGVAGIAHVIQLSIAPVFLLSGVSAMLGCCRTAWGADHRPRTRPRAYGWRARPPARGAHPEELTVLERRARLSATRSACARCALLVCGCHQACSSRRFREGCPTDQRPLHCGVDALAGGLVTFLRRSHLGLRYLRIGPLP